MKKILIILGHPDKETFCGSLADEYEAGAAATGAEVRRLNIGDLDFDPVLKHGYKVIQELEPDLKMAQESILWAEHLVFVYPTWWATMPALLKGFIDRVFLPGFAFSYHEKDPWWDRLLKGRSGRIITTMDAPYFYYWIVYGNAGNNAMKWATLKFCGVNPVRTTVFGNVKGSTSEKRTKWLGKTRRLGEQNK